MSTPQPIDPVSAIVAVMMAFASPAAAYVLGTYSIIFIAASFGAGWALMRRPSSSLVSAIWFVILVAGSSTLLTASVSELINLYLKMGTINYLLAPVALIIGGVGHDWPKVLIWSVKIFTGFITKKPRDLT